MIKSPGSLAPSLYVGLAAAVLGIAVVLHIAWAEYRSMLAHPSEVGADANFQDYQVSAKDKVLLKGWYRDGSNGKLIMLLHGYWGNRLNHLDEALALSALGYTVVLPDIRAHGQSGGKVIGYGTWEVDDILVTLDYFLAKPGNPISSIGLYGHSMGGALAAMTAARDSRIAAVVLSSTPSSVQDLAYDESPWLPSLQSKIRMQTVRLMGIAADDLDFTKAVAKIAPRPVLLIRGERDQVVPLARSQKLEGAAGDPKIIINYPDLGHEDIRHAANPSYQDSINRFFGKYLN